MEEMEVVSIKLSTGEEIIGKLVGQEGNEWILQDARSILMMNDGQLRLGPVLFSATKENNVNVYRPLIVVYSDHVRPEFLEAYQQAVSPLSIAKPGITKPSIIMG